MQRFTTEKKGALCLPGAEAEEDYHPQDFYKTCFTLVGIHTEELIRMSCLLFSMVLIINLCLGTFLELCSCPALAVLSYRLSAF